MYSSLFVCICRFNPLKELILILKQTPGCEGGRKEKQMNEWEWMRGRGNYWKKSNSLLLMLTLPAIIEKKFQKSTALEFRLHPPRAAADSHTHTHLHILLREWTLSDSSLLGDSSPPPDPARLCCPALHTQSQPTRVTWHAAVCVCVCLLCGDMQSPLRQRYTKHSMSLWSVTAPSWPFLLIKTPPPTSVCVCGCLCLLLSVLNTNWAPVTCHSERDRCCIALVSRIKGELVWRRELWIYVCVSVCVDITSTSRSHARRKNN